MNNNLLQKLKEWRRKIADMEGVAVFRVFSNDALEDIAEFKPKDEEALLLIKGIKEKKFEKYGKAILALVNDKNNNKQMRFDFSVDDDASINVDKFAKKIKEVEEKNVAIKPLSVSDYLDILNNQLSKSVVRIQGEISSLDIRDRVVYFSLKDLKDGSVISCLIWKNIYEMSGVQFEMGLEIILEGSPDIYKPSGRLSFKVSLVELVGEGALKKAYDLLKKKLEIDGLFLVERKKRIPDFPQKIGLITSATGAVIHDFSTNLGKYGFHIKFIDSKVEGQVAVSDIISAIERFNKIDIDVLVIIRGGGSLESLQAFNNESLVRKIANFSKPVICGIGHEKDTPLASLVADKMVSTPTAVTSVLNESWRNAIHKVNLNKEMIFSLFKDFVSGNQKKVNRYFDVIKKSFQSIFDDFKKVDESLKRSFVSIKSRILEINRSVAEYPRVINGHMKFLIKNLTENILSAEKLIIKSDPEKQLKLGYSIAQVDGVLVRKINQIKKGQMVNVRIEDGSFMSEVKIINKNK